MDFASLTTLRRTHPAWRLLMADHAPLIASFLQRVFIQPNLRVMAQQDLASKLEDELFHLRETLGIDGFARGAGEYLDEWARNDKGWLRKFYPPGSDEAHFDLTPAAEKALAWLESLTQRTVARLSQQLRRYLDDRAFLENRRIMQLLHEIETSALAVREALPQGGFMEVDEPAPTIHMPMERPMYSPPVKPLITAEVRVGDEARIDADALFDQVIVDKARLQTNIRRLLSTRHQVTLREVTLEHPIQEGLAEVVTYLCLAADDENALFDEATPDCIAWCDEQGWERIASLPRVIFNR